MESRSVRTRLVANTIGFCTTGSNLPTRVPRTMAMLAATCAMSDDALKRLRPLQEQYRTVLNLVLCRPVFRFTVVWVS